MLVKNAIAQARAVTGSVVDDSVLYRWLSELDGKLALEFYRADGWLPYTAENDGDCELLVPFPWDGLYIHHLEAMTYYTNGEYDRYENARAMCEKKLDDFRKFVARSHYPITSDLLVSDGGSGATVIRGGANAGLWYALSAYAVAVKHGYKGTEEEWLASLNAVAVTPDYAQNDPTAAGYIKNRPCYAQEETIKWDGSTEGLESVSLGEGATLVRISALTPTADGLVGRTATMTAGGQIMNVTITSETIVEGENCRAIMYGGEVPITFVVDKAGDVSFMDVSVTFQAAGVYVFMEAMTELGVTGLSITVDIIHKLDAKFLPAGAGGFKVVTTAEASNFDPAKFQPGDVVLVIQEAAQ